MSKIVGFGADAAKGSSSNWFETKADKYRVLTPEGAQEFAKFLKSTGREDVLATSQVKINRVVALKAADGSWMYEHGDIADSTLLEIISGPSGFALVKDDSRMVSDMIQREEEWQAEARKQKMIWVGGGLLVAAGVYYYFFKRKR